jgi:hypothetical protein
MSTALSIEVSGINADQQQVLAEILADVKASVDRLARAARRWVELPERAREKIIEQSPASLREFWGRLERVGLGSLHPQLATVGGTAARLLGRLPLIEQERYLRELVPVVVSRGRGWDIRLIDVAELSDDQRKQVFKIAPAGAVEVRDAEMQKAWLADKAARRVLAEQTGATLKRVERAGWRVERGRVFVKEGLIVAGITRAQLERMIADLE